jgi:uncharacterized protein YndB with AHSA1/START domain
MTDTTTETSIRHQIEVEVPIDRAFAVFVEQWDEIKPHELYDRFEDGSRVRWSRVLAFEPPDRFVISWDLSPQWQIETDPTRTSEVEVTFTAIGDHRTRVDLEHRHLDRHGPGWEGVREGVDAPDGWPLYLQRYAAASDARAS